MKRILIVDDEPDALRMLSLALEGEGYDVVAADNGEEALKQAAANRPDLIVLDVVMPQMDGYEVCRRLRRIPEFVHVPILFLSARSQVDDRVQGLQVGGNDYVVKPVSPQELMARIGALLGLYFSKESYGYSAAFFGSKGGVGTTTIAVNLALAIRRQTNARVILVDGHDEGGDVGVFLNLAAPHHAGELIDVVEQMDDDMLQSALVEHGSGLQVLLAPPVGFPTTLVSPTFWRSMLSSLRRMADFVIFDGPTLHSLAWKPVIDRVDEVFIVSTPEITAMKRLRASEEWVSSDHVKIHVLLNRYTDDSGFSPRAIASILDTMHITMRMAIPEVGPANSYAINRGVPLLMGSKRNPMSRAIQRLAMEIVQEHAPALQPVKSRGGFWRLFGR